MTEKYYIIIEYGIESCYNRTLDKTNRSHTFEQSVEAIQETADYGINTGAHLIFGLPGETCSKQEISGRPCVYYDGYWSKFYEPPTDNLAAKKFYARLGFKHDTTDQTYILGDDAFQGLAGSSG